MRMKEGFLDPPTKLDGDYYVQNSFNTAIQTIETPLNFSDNSITTKIKNLTTEFNADLLKKNS
jgi:hypothetical protein